MGYDGTVATTELKGKKNYIEFNMNNKFEHFGEFWIFFSKLFIFYRTYCSLLFLGEAGLFACMLHANELPLRHLLAKIDGETIGPQAFSGPNGKLLASCRNLPIVNLEPTGEFNSDI